MQAAGLNFRDVLFTLGLYPDSDVSLGAECAGVIESVGAGVTALRPGQQVFGFVSGSLASQATVPAAFIAPRIHLLRLDGSWSGGKTSVIWRFPVPRIGE